MILTIFIFMGVIGALCLILGYTQRIPWALFVGYTIFFLLFLGMRVGGVDYESSTLIQTNGTTYTVTPVYSTYTNNWPAFLLTIASLFGLIYTYFSRVRD